MRRPTHCRECGRGPMIPGVHWKPGDLRYGARGLCHGDYARRRHQGTLDEFSRLTVPHKDTIEEWTFLKGQGLSTERMAEIIGISSRALEIAITRHERAVQNA